MEQKQPPAAGVAPGYRIGDWRLLGPLGAGSWGTVHAAEHVTDGSPAAVKLLRTDLLPPGQRDAVGELVQREVAFSLAADHPHVVRTHAAVTLQDPQRPELDGVTALVMDRAERSLYDLLSGPGPDRGGAGGPLQPAEAARLLRGVAEGLAHIHDSGWVHADLKPGNVLLGPEGAVWLADFGLTTELEGTHAYVPPLGSLDHVPPEWWSERTGRGAVVRPTADIWAFGVLAHQVLSCGLHPFPGRTARARALAAQEYARGAAPLRLDPDVPEPWRELITDCLRPDHASRTELTARQLAARVRALTGPPPRGTSRRRKRLAAGAAVLAVTAAAGSLLSSYGPWSPAGGQDRAPAVSGPVNSAQLPANSDVPVPLRPVISRAAGRCPERDVTPVLIASLLKAQSHFDPKAVRGDAAGIALWTPADFNRWAVDGDGDGRTNRMSAPDAIATMGPLLCHLDRSFTQHHVPGDAPALLAAGFHTDEHTVRNAHGVPPSARDYVQTVLRYRAEYVR